MLKRITDVKQTHVHKSFFCFLLGFLAN